MENKTTDKGWAAMQTLLDREMPQKSRRRGMIWWWLFLVPLAGYGGWQWLRHEQAEKAPVQEYVQPIASAAQRQSSSIHGEKGTTASELTASELPKISAPGSPYKQNIGKKRQKKDIRYAPAPCLNDEDILLEPLPQQRFGSSDPGYASTYQTGALPGKWPESLETKSTHNRTAKAPASFSGMNQPLKSFRPHWAFGATSTISTEEFNAINGFSTGVTVDWHFARKWGIRSGLFYNIHTPQKKYRPVASVLSSTYTSNIEGSIAMMDIQTGNVVNNAIGNPLYNDSLSAQVYIPVNRLERLEIPVSAFWEATSWFKVLGGFTLTRTLLTQADHQNYSGAYVLSLNDQTATDGASKLSTHELDNWHADVSLGAGFRLGSSFELGLTAKMPLKQQKSKTTTTETTYLDNGILSSGGAPSGSRPVMALYGTLYF